VSTSRRSRSAWPTVPRLLGFAVLVEIAFLLVVPRYVTVDGAAHLGGAALIRDVLQGAGQLHLRYVQFDAFPAPNVLPGLALSGVLFVLDPAAAEKLLQVAYVISLPLALLYAIRAVGHGSDWLALLAIPFTFTFAFQYGFYDFSVGVALFLLAAGFYWRHRQAPRWRDGITFAVLTLALYLTHLVPFLELGVFLGTTAGMRILRSLGTGGVREAAVVLRATSPFIIGILPAAALAVIFLLATRTAAPAEYLNPFLQAIGVLGLALGLATTHPLEILVAVGIAVTLAGLLVTVAWRRLRPPHEAGRTLRDDDALFAYAGAALVIAFAGPAAVQSGGSYIPERLALFPVYGLALWLGAHAIPRRAASFAALVFVLAAVSLSVLRLPTTLDLSAAAVELESIAPCLAPQSTLVQANLADLPAGPLGRTDPFGSEAGRVSAPTRGHDLGNWEGSFPFFLYRNRPDNDTFRWLLTNERGLEVPPGLDIEAYERRPDGRVDYVLVVGREAADDATLASRGWTSLLNELQSSYRRVAASSHGLVEVWELQEAALQTSGDAQRATTVAGTCTA
jgi:hypothetical protein